MCSKIWLTITTETVSVLCYSESEFYTETVSIMLGPISRLSFPCQNKEYKVYIIICPKQYSRYRPQVRPTSILLIFICVGAYKPPHIQAQLKMKRRFTNVFLCLSNHSQPLRDLWKCATYPDQMGPCVHWLKWMIFGAFVLNCDLLDNMNTTAVKFGTSVSNGLCQSQLESHIVKLFIAQCNI